MTPQLVHRYAFPVREVIEHLLGDAVGDCEAWNIRIEGDEVVVDVVGPAEVTFRVGDYEYTVDGRSDPKPETATETRIEERAASDAPSPVEEPQPASSGSPVGQADELKGGPLAQRAAIACGERGFWTFLGVDSADAARTWILQRCAISSRRMLDHDTAAAGIWRKVDGNYRLWLEGHDVEPT
jgi:hypothetical protein